MALLVSAVKANLLWPESQQWMTLAREERRPYFHPINIMLAKAGCTGD
jgi:hypothetical protein